MKLIDISTPKHPNTFTMVDDADFDWLNQWKWCLHNPGGYAVRYRTVDGKRCSIYMHRELLKPPSGMVCDHRSGDRLDNRRENLRVCAYVENNRNRKKSPTSKLAKGVVWVQRHRRFRAHLKVRGRKIMLGSFLTEAEAAAAYNAGAIKYFGGFARLNNLDLFNQESNHG